jgi:hypothetical protein
LVLFHPAVGSSLSTNAAVIAHTAALASAGVVSCYVHMPVAPGAGRIAAVVGLEATGAQQLAQDTEQQMSQLASQLSMHAAGMNTQQVSAGSIPPNVMASVRQDFASQTEALMPGKPAQVLNKIIDGKVAKWLKEVSRGCTACTADCTSCHCGLYCKVEQGSLSRFEAWWVAYSVALHFCHCCLCTTCAVTLADKCVLVQHS